MELPYAPRPSQAELVAAVSKTCSTGGHGVFEAATGTGKTIALLVGALDAARHPDRRIVYLTRTNSQQAQVVKEHAALRADQGDATGLLIPFMGRRQYCPLLKDDERFRDGTPEELGKLCSDAKRKAAQAHETGKPVHGACPYYERLLEDGTGPVEALLASSGPDDAPIGPRIAACGTCPYESLKALLPKAKAVVAPYIFLMDGRLRETFLGWMGATPEQTTVIIDEAHNLPEAVRSHHSPRLGSVAIKRAMREAEQYQDPALAGTLLSTSLLHALDGALHDMAHDHVLGDDDGRVPAGDLEQRLMERLRVPSTTLARAAKDLEVWGDVIREERREAGRLPRSYLGSIGSFLTLWTATREEPYAHLVTGGDAPGVEAYLLDPATHLHWLLDFHSTVHASGTLAPLRQHVDLCGLPEIVTATVFASPFEQDRLRLVGVEGIHRRWRLHQDDPDHAHRQQQAARACLASVPGKTGLFFPSHAMLEAYLEEGFLHGVARPCHREVQGMDTTALMRVVEAFRADSDPDALLLAVLGGRVTEGLDFPGDTMVNAILFGVPYPRPSARSQALIDHLDRKHDGLGWTYAVHNPVGRLMRQAVGRLVRSAEDTGRVAFLDERVARFRPFFPGLHMVADAGRLPQALLGDAVPSRQGFVPATDYASTISRT